MPGNMEKGMTFREAAGKIKWKASMKNRLTLLFVVMVLVPLLTVGAIIDRNICNNAKADFNTATTAQIKQVDDTITLFFDGIKKDARWMAALPELRNKNAMVTKYMDQPGDAKGMIEMNPLAAGGDEAVLYQIFERVVKAHPEISTVSWGTSDGGYLQYPAIPRKKGYDSRERDWYKDNVRQPDRVALTDPFLTSKGVPTVGIFTAVRDQENGIKGVLGFNIDLPIITDMIDKIKIGDTGYVILVDSKNTIIADPKKPELNFKNVQEMNEELYKKLDQLQGNSMELTLDGADVVATVIGSEATGWKYICIADKADMYKEASTLRQLLLTTTFIVLVLVLIIAWFLSRYIASPLLAMMQTCRELESGDFRDKQSILEREDEFGQLSSSLHAMQAEIRKVLKKVHGLAEQVAASSEELTASSDQSSQAAQSIAASIAEVAEGTQQQLHATEETRQVMDDVTKKIQQIAAHADHAAMQSGQVAEKARYGDQSVLEAVGQIGQVETAVLRSAEVVGRLGERSKEIGQIIDTIANIANQTNLLALNAAIEAARAGEQGRGFAVVADEVRKLAEQSQEAANEIAVLIGEIQTDTEQAVVAMTDGKTEVQNGTRAIHTIGQSFGEIAELIGNISGQVKEISQSIQQMVAASDQVGQSVKKIDGHGKKSTEEAHTVSAAAEEQLASMQEMAAASQELAKLAQDLQNEVTAFKL